MVVIASRQTGERPETIRTRLARFMPRTSAAAWSVAWSAQTEREAEAASEEELSAADHIGCYGAAVAHALAKAEVATTRLHVTLTSKGSPDGTPQPIVVDVRAGIAGAPLDAEIFQGIVRRAAPTCPAWAGLVANPGLRLNAILDNGLEPGAQAVPAAPVARPQTPVNTARPLAAPMPKLPSRVSLSSMPRMSMPAWMTPRMGIMLVVALAALANITHHL